VWCGTFRLSVMCISVGLSVMCRPTLVARWACHRPAPRSGATAPWW
jgi:hypothetical protein